MFGCCSFCWARSSHSTISFKPLESDLEISNQGWITSCSTSDPYDSHTDGEVYDKNDESIGQITMTATTSSEEFTNKEKDIKKSEHSLLMREKFFRSYQSTSCISNCDYALLKPQINLDISYNKIIGTLDIFINYCRNLPAVDRLRCTSNPYVQVYLLPDVSKFGKRRTQTKWDTVNPNFDERLTPSFYLSPDEIYDRKLWISVWHSNPRSAWIKAIRNNLQSCKKICLGEITLPCSLNDSLKNSNCFLEEAKTALCCRDFEDSTPTLKGVISLKLQFVPKNDSSLDLKCIVDPNALGSLEVRLCYAKNLPLRSNGKLPKPYCKCYLINLTSKSSEPLKQKTPTENSTCNPKWNHTIIYHNYTLEQLKECCLEINVWDHNSKSEKTFLGGLRLCNYNFSENIHEKNKQIYECLGISDSEKELWERFLIGHYKIRVGAILSLRYFSPIRRHLITYNESQTWHSCSFNSKH